MTMPWWEAEPDGPWTCTGCGVSFDCACHLSGRWLCPSPTCSRLCEPCLVDAQMHAELHGLIESVEGEESR